MLRKIKGKWLYAIVLMVLLVGVVILRNGATHTKKIPGNIKEAITRVHSWEKLPFVGVSDEQKLAEYVRHANLDESQATLSNVQREKLYSFFLTTVRAYSSGNYDDFLKFRKPEGIELKPFESEWNCITAAWFRAHPDASAKNLPDDNALYRWWIEQDSFYKGYWQGIMISAEDAYQVLGIPHYTGGEKPKVGFYVTKSPLWESANVLFETYNSGGVKTVDSSFEYIPDNLKEDTEKYGKEDFLTCWIHFFVKPMRGDSPMSLNLRVVWDVQTEQWVPVELGRGDMHTIWQSKYFDKNSRIFKF